MESIQIVSIILEIFVVVVAFMIAVSKKQFYGYGFALTFAIYVYYDSAKLIGSQTGSSLLAPLFFVATISALISMLLLYKKI